MADKMDRYQEAEQRIGKLLRENPKYGITVSSACRDLGISRPMIIKILTKLRHTGEVEKIIVHSKHHMYRPVVSIII